MSNDSEEELINPTTDKQLVEEVTELAINMLVSIYNQVSEEDLEETAISFYAGSVCETLELLVAYVDRYENIDLETMMRSADMNYQDNTPPSDSQNIH